MKNIFIIAALTCGLAACSDRNGAGFTGLGSEPASVAQQGTAGGLTGGSGYSSLSGPVVASESNPRRVEKQVRAAFAAPVEQPLEVRLAGDTVRMNLVEVRGQRYAVLRPVAGSTMTTATTKSFQAYARTLTGCAQAGPFYADKNGPGAATALICG